MTHTNPPRPMVAMACAVATILLLAATASNAVLANGNKEGLEIKIRAQNRSVDDSPAFCPGIGPGLKGDSLKVDVSTSIDGTPSGRAIFTGDDGAIIDMNIDKVFVYFGGLALMDSTTGDTVAIWLGNYEEAGPNYNPVHITVESPRGCGNNISTFTVDADKVTTQIKFQ